MKLKQDPNQARKRNFAKFRLAGMHSALRSICEGPHYCLTSPLLDKERTALNSIRGDIKTVLESWDKNYIELKRKRNERKI